MIMTQKELDSKLFRADQNGSLEILTQAIADGASVTAVDHNGYAALSMAVMSGHAHCVEFLISQKADVNSKSLEGWSALHLSAAHEHLGCMKVLLRNGADIHATCTRTFQEVDSYNQEVTVHVDGYTPLHLAVENHALKIVEYLITCGAELSLRNEDGETPLDIADNFNNTGMREFISSLLEQTKLDEHLKCDNTHAEEMHF